MKFFIEYSDDKNDEKIKVADIEIFEDAFKFRAGNPDFVENMTNNEINLLVQRIVQCKKDPKLNKALKELIKNTLKLDKLIL
jgi:hypothetical protein